MSTWSIGGNTIGLASNYPYNASIGTCHKVVPAFSMNGAYSLRESLATWVKRQPISVGIDGKTQQFQLYKSGILYPDGCTTDWNNNLLAVGYGTLSGKTIFKLKNSWGAR